MLEMFTDLWAKRDELLATVKALEDASTRGTPPTYAQQTAVHEQLNNVNDALGEPRVEFDPLVAQWERDIAEGRVPDLEAGRT